MKLKFKIILLFLILAGALLAARWFLEVNVLILESGKKQISVVLKSSRQPPAPIIPVGYDLPIIQPFAKTKYLRLRDPRWNVYDEQTKLDPDYEWKRPIEFYGKVVDENNLPVTDALVEIEWIGVDERDGPDGVGHRTQKSGPDGLFTISGIKGKCMTARVSKDGYYTKKTLTNCTYEYGGFWEPNFIEPDRNNPVVYHLVKRPVAELTYHIGDRYYLPPPVLEAHLNMLNLPTLSEAPADILVRITRSPILPANSKDEVWKLEIEGRGDTELILSDDEFLIKAPLEGYQPRIVHDYHGVNDQKITFYVRSKQRGYYAGAILNVTPWHRNRNIDYATINLDAVVNPNNSQIVDYDNEKNIRMIEEKNNRRRRR